MYLQEILEVAIGLVFMWLVMSIAAMTLQEWIGNLLKWRSTDLYNNIKRLLSDTSLADDIYKHPLVSSLFGPPKKNGKRGLPSYIPSGKFAAALFDTVVNAGTEKSPVRTFTSEIDKQLQMMHDPDLQKLAQDEWETILVTAKQVAASGAGQNAVDSLKSQIQSYGTRYPEAKDTLDVLLQQIDDHYKEFQAEQRSTEPDADLAMRQFRLGLKALAIASGGDDKDNKVRIKLKENIETILRSARISAEKGEAAVVKARKEFEYWFNDSMDRLSGTYKRKAQITSFIIGVVLAIFMNVDSINLANNLWREPTLRQAIVAQAQNYPTPDQQVQSTNTDPNNSVANPIQNIQNLQTELQALNIPFGWTSEPIAYQTTVPCVPFALSTHDEQGRDIQIMGLHIGNSCYPLVNTPSFTASNILAWLTKLLGMLITGAAAAQGAPFWFDILKKLVNVRSTGVKPEEKAPKAVG